MEEPNEKKTWMMTVGINERREWKHGGRHYCPSCAESYDENAGPTGVYLVPVENTEADPLYCRQCREMEDFYAEEDRRREEIIPEIAALLANLKADIFKVNRDTRRAIKREDKEESLRLCREMQKLIVWKTQDAATVGAIRPPTDLEKAIRLLEELANMT